MAAGYTPNGLPARRQLPIQVLTRPGVEQLFWSDTMRYRHEP